MGGEVTADPLRGRRLVVDRSGGSGRVVARIEPVLEVRRRHRPVGVHQPAEAGARVGHRRRPREADARGRGADGQRGQARRLLEAEVRRLTRRQGRGEVHLTAREVGAHARVPAGRALVAVLGGAGQCARLRIAGGLAGGRRERAGARAVAGRAGRRARGRHAAGRDRRPARVANSVTSKLNRPEPGVAKGTTTAGATSCSGRRSARPPSLVGALVGVLLDRRTAAGDGDQELATEVGVDRRALGELRGGADGGGEGVGRRGAVERDGAVIGRAGGAARVGVGAADVVGGRVVGAREEVCPVAPADRRGGRSGCRRRSRPRRRTERPRRR